MALGTCSHCGHSVLGDLPFATFPSAEQEAASILEEAIQVDEFIIQINAYRAKRLRRLNALRSTTRVFPPEMLSLIFQHYIPQPKFDTLHSDRQPHARTPTRFIGTDSVPTPFPQVTILGAVCNQWREIAYSTPRLWDAIEVKVGRRTIEAKANLIRLYLANARGTSLSLSLKLDPSLVPAPLYPLQSDSLSELELQPIFSSIWEGAEKIKRFFSTVYPGIWLGLLSDKFHQLEDLSLWTWPRPGRAYTQNSGPQVTPWSTLPNLKRMLLGGVTFRVPFDSPPCPSITVLNLDQRDLKTCLNLLLLCPNLIEYRVRPTTELEPVIRSISLDEQRVFPHMKIFHVYCALQLPFSAVLLQLRMPALESLGLGATARDQTVHLENLLSFIRTLPPTWSTLSLNYLLSDSERIMVKMFAVIPECVKNLCLLYSDTSAFETVLNALKNEGSVRPRAAMPGLRRLRIMYWQHDYRRFGTTTNPTPPPFPQMILRMLGERKHEIVGVNDSFSLEMEADHRIDWTSVRDELRALISGGLRVRIVVSDKLIDCLQEIYDEAESS